MPKLSPKAAKQVESSEAASGYVLLDEGRYAAQLKNVTQKEGADHPYWVWEFHNLHDQEGNRHPGRMWNNTSLSPKASGFLKATFDAFGYTADSDTAEMIGEWVVLYIIKSVIPSGSRAGQESNKVRQVLPFAEADWPIDTAASTAGGDKDDVY